MFSAAADTKNNQNVKQVSVAAAAGELANIKLWQMSQAANNETSKHRAATRLTTTTTNNSNYKLRAIKNVWR